MYRVEYVVGHHWSVIDASGRTVFVGTKQRVEDWLDRQENIQRRPSPDPPRHGQDRRFLRMLRHLVRLD